MPKRPSKPAPAGPSSLGEPKAKTRGFDLTSVRTRKTFNGTRLTMKKNLLPGKSGQR